GADAPAFVVSANLDADALLDFVAHRAAEINAAPFGCDRLQRLNTGAARVALAPLFAPDAIGTLRGGHLVVQELVDNPDGGRAIPQGFAMVDTTDTAQLWDFAAQRLLADDVAPKLA